MTWKLSHYQTKRSGCCYIQITQSPFPSQVNASDEEEGTKQEDYDVFRVYISDEEHMSRDREERTGASTDGPQDSCYPESEGALIGEEGNEHDLNPTEEDLGMENLSREELCTLRRRLSDPKVSWGRGRTRGRGFKRRRWGSSQDRRPPGMTNQQDLWCLATAGMAGGFGLDYNQEGLKTGGFISLELPRLDFSLGDAQGEKASPLATNSLTQFALDQSSCDAGEGSSA